MPKFPFPDIVYVVNHAILDEFLGLSELSLSEGGGNSPPNKKIFPPFIP